MSAVTLIVIVAIAVGVLAGFGLGRIYQFIRDTKILDGARASLTRDQEKLLETRRNLEQTIEGNKAMRDGYQKTIDLLKGAGIIVNDDGTVQARQAQATPRQQDEMFQNMRNEGFAPASRVAHDLVEGGKCTSYDEAYALLDSTPAGGTIETYRGHMKKM